MLTTGVTACLLALPGVRHAVGAVQVYVGDKPVEFKKAKPIYRGSLLLIPLRAVVEKMGGTMVDSPLGRRIFVTVGTRRVDLSLAGGRSWVNGVPRTVKAAPWISKGEVVVPLRFFNLLGATTVNDPRRGMVQILPLGGLRTESKKARH